MRDLVDRLQEIETGAGLVRDQSLETLSVRGENAKEKESVNERENAKKRGKENEKEKEKEKKKESENENEKNEKKKDVKKSNENTRKKKRGNESADVNLKATNQVVKN